MSAPGDAIDAALLEALRDGDLEAVAALVERRGEGLAALDTNDDAALARARATDAEILALAGARRDGLRDELEALVALRGRLAQRPRSRPGARYIDRRA